MLDKLKGTHAADACGGASRTHSAESWTAAFSQNQLCTSDLQEGSSSLQRSDGVPTRCPSHPPAPAAAAGLGPPWVSCYRGDLAGLGRAAGSEELRSISGRQHGAISVTSAGAEGL